MSVADVIFPLVGVVIGGGITAGTEIARDHRADRQRARAERQSQVHALRIVANAVMMASVEIEVANKREALSDFPASRRATETWQQHQAALSSLDHEEWQDIDNAMRYCYLAGQVTPKHAHTSPWAPSLEAAEKALTKAGTRVERLQRALAEPEPAVKPARTVTVGPVSVRWARRGTG